MLYTKWLQKFNERVKLDNRRSFQLFACKIKEAISFKQLHKFPNPEHRQSV